MWKIVWDEYIPDTKEGISLDSNYNLSSLNFYMPVCNGYLWDSDYGYMQEKPNNMKISLETRKWLSSYRFYLYPVRLLSQGISSYNSKTSGINGTSFLYWSWKEKKWIYAINNWNIQKAAIDKANNRLVIDVALRGLWWCRTSFNYTYLLGFNEENKRQASIQKLISAEYEEKTITDSSLEKRGSTGELPYPTVFLMPIPTPANSAPLLSDQAKTSLMVKDVRDDLTTAEIKLKFDPSRVKVADIESPTLPDTGLEIVIDKRIDNQKGEVEIKAVVREKERGTETQPGQESPLLKADEKETDGIISIEDVENIAPIANLILQSADGASGSRAPFLSMYDIINAVSISSIELKNADGSVIEANVVSNDVVVIAPEQSLKASYCYPNPSTNGEVVFDKLTKQVKVRIYNLAGELVYDRAHTTDGKWVWKCENNDGDKAASGVYVYILTCPETDETRKGRVGVIR
ncbi:MAG: T9SS type A sorting domain-containing protein [bacterium]